MVSLFFWLVSCQSPTTQLFSSSCKTSPDSIHSALEFPFERSDAIVLTGQGVDYANAPVLQLKAPQENFLTPLSFAWKFLSLPVPQQFVPSIPSPVGSRLRGVPSTPRDPPKMFLV